jgi:tetratricopeptide (TPR) repeat protein
MRILFPAFLLSAALTGVAMQSPEPPLGETRLTVHTLLREDVFAGFRANDMKRFGRAERNLEILLKERPADKASLLAWKGGMTVYRAILAHEGGRAAEFNQQYAAARELFTEALKISTGNDGVTPIIGGSYAILGDRLPEAHRAAAWTEAYGAFRELWKGQGSIVEKLPEHLRGELLSGLAVSAYRTGRIDESNEFVDKMITLLPDTAYQAAAKQWKEKPGSVTLTCKSCHAPGRLADRLAAINK